MPMWAESSPARCFLGAELFPWFLRLCQLPSQGKHMTVKAFVSKWTGPFALLRYLQAFFLKAEEDANVKTWMQMNHSSADREAQRRWKPIPRLTVVHHAAQPPAESHAPGEPPFGQDSEAGPLTSPGSQHWLHLGKLPPPASSHVKVNTGAWTSAAALRVSY